MGLGCFSWVSAARSTLYWLEKQAFLDVLTSRVNGSGKKRGIRVNHSSVTSIQEYSALTYFYAKHVVHEDGLTTGSENV